MMHPLVPGLVLALAGPAIAASPPDMFIDDRSSPERVVTSLYNAIDRHEYLRAWSYFTTGSAPSYGEFRDGYADTDRVELRIGETTSEGAAGSIHSSVPVALKATGTDGGVTVFRGCYRLTQVQPAVQDTPPFRPIQIDGGSLEPTTQPFETAMGDCD
ncbi:hypothetical protein [Paracoccus marinaquae]|uniref:Uncharacterized protein n=1 Tax=Paracoccus marinaquae TaxID=2841926 RepID=A0ABS6AHJ8_9RHOB|nr:hypothetical protein [Paracoccus marinaquae]MBU3029109.1 hypothetical protein [Paracoccus marinaquae]